jgi:acyl-coenzyme A thioesterase PaaI-like protein
MLLPRNGIIMIIPFLKIVGIKDGILDNHHDVQNHIGSIHAGAQFTFAETASGVYLSSLFSDKEGEYVPLLREASVKYKKQALTTLRSEVFVKEIALEKFLESYARKGRASIVAEVKLLDKVGDVTCVGSFKWYVQGKS